MLMFREEKSPEDEIKAWQFWHGRQHSVKQRILDAGKFLFFMYSYISFFIINPIDANNTIKKNIYNSHFDIYYRNFVLIPNKYQIHLNINCKFEPVQRSCKSLHSINIF